MDTQHLPQLDRFHVHQKEKATSLTYRVFADADGKPGELVAFAQERKWAFKEKVTVYADEAKETEIARLGPRKVPELSHGRVVTAPDGKQLGVFGLRLSKSMAKTTWFIEQDGLPRITARERDPKTAVFRRVWNLAQPDWLEVPFLFKYHFDLVLDDQVVGAVEKRKNLDERYLARAEDDRLDRRLLIAFAVALDVLQYRAV